MGFEVGGEYFAAGEQANGDAVLLRFDGEDWETFPLDGSEGVSAPVAIWAADPQHVFAAGHSDVWTLDGGAAQRVLANAPFNITSLWGLDANDVRVGGYAVASNCADCDIPPRAELHHFDGMRWRAVSTSIQGRIDSLWGAAPDDVRAVGSVEGQASMHFDGVQWRAVESDGLAARSVHALPDGSVFAYASSREDESFVLKWDGDSFALSDWTLPALDPSAHVRLSSYGSELLLLNG